MSEEKLSQDFKQWCIVEIFGHVKIAGLVTEQTIGGCSFVRVDVPEVDGSAAFTKLYGNGAIYSIQPVSEELVRAYIKRYPVAPMTVYMPEIRQIETNRISFQDFAQRRYEADPDGFDATEEHN